MEILIYDIYLRKMRDTLDSKGGGAEERKQLVDEMKEVVKTGNLTMDQVYKIYFSATLPITGIYGT